MKNILAAVLLSFSILACNSSGVQKPSAQYEEKKTSLEDMERDSPLKFLRIAGASHNNLLNQTVLSGTISNKATLVGYKNIKIQVTYKDEEGAVIDKQKQMLDMEVQPGSAEDFKIKTSHVKGINTVSFEILEAVAEK